MAGLIDEVKRVFRQGGIVTRVIGINVVLFVLFALAQVVLKLFGVDDSPWLHFLDLPASLPQLALRPWTLITYMFMHASVWHLVFNMLWLYWFGQIALYFFSARHLRGLYVVGGLMGGVLYVVAYNVFPLFAPQLSSSLLVGASASILAIVVATAVKEPNYPLRLMLIGSISMKWLAVITVLIDMLLIASTNAGGHIAHLGGALAGWWFAAGLKKGYDITAWVNSIIDFVGGIFHPAAYRTNIKVHKQKRAKKPISSGKKRKKKASESPVNDHAADYAYNQTKKQQSDEIDRILEKIKKSGYAGLTAEEKRKLFEASNR
ncbi:MAG: rhomboid family intramembrane serine protease [Bacteroidaceae bacterium]|nr:rhomboid family intramembrane serine protease [Bacteroidaceae bacterium]